MEVIIDANFGMALGPEKSETLLEFSDSAVKKLKSLQQEEGNSNLKLRVSVYGVGCSGFVCSFSLDEEVKATDCTGDKDGAIIIFSLMFYNYLAGSTVDYTEGL